MINWLNEIIPISHLVAVICDVFINNPPRITHRPIRTHAEIFENFVNTFIDSTSSKKFQSVIPTEIINLKSVHTELEHNGFYLILYTSPLFRSHMAVGYYI